MTSQKDLKQFNSGGGTFDAWKSVIEKTPGRRRDIADITKKPTGAPIALEDGAEERFDFAKDLIASGDWPIRGQYERPTCVAFAVVAAEELYLFKKTGTLKKFSEEFLYYWMRHRDFEPDFASMSGSDESNYKNDGGTYLKQAHQVLARKGLCRLEMLVYEPDLASGMTTSKWNDDIDKDAQNHMPAESLFEHNSWKTKDLSGEEDPWQSPLGKDSLSSKFLAQLKKKCPVAANFATYDAQRAFGWSRDNREGNVKYPDLEGQRPDGGHVVCITGFEPADDNSAPSRGWFHFRNSWSTGFGQTTDSDDQPTAPALGYGTISLEDVDAYCWEYLFRKD